MVFDDALRFSDEWTLVEDQLVPTRAATGALFTTANGYLGVRAGHREPVGGADAVLVSGCYETRPYVHPEAGFAYPERYQTMLPATDPTATVLRVDSVAVLPDAGTWLEHGRTLDLRAGLVCTYGRWRSPAGALVAVRSRRLVRLEEPVLWFEVEVEPLEGPAQVEIDASVVANTSDRTCPDEPESLARAWGRVLRPVATLDEGGRLGLAHRAPLSGRTLACVTELTTAAEITHRSLGPDLAQWSVRGCAGPGRPLRVLRRSAFADGPGPDNNGGAAHAVLHRAAIALRRSTAAAEQVPTEEHAVEQAVEQAVATQERRLAEFWAAATVDVEGDRDLQGALRFCAFQVAQATFANGGHPVPAKGLTGQGYQGHHLWEQEIYVGQALTLLAPQIARAMLTFRAATLPAARARAAELSLSGALFPWRTITGDEASAFFPAGTAQHHVNAAIAWAVAHYVACTGDTGFLDEGGVELLVETARLWAALGHTGADGYVRINGVTGPDEYTALVNNNLYTNVMAAANVRRAADAVADLARRDPVSHAALARTLQLSPAEPECWRQLADRMLVPYDENLGVHPQDDSFLGKPEWDLRGTPQEHFPLQRHHHLLTLYRHQVVKQADVLLAQMLVPSRFSAADRRRNYDYYEPRTSHDSSLSAPVHASVAVDVDAGPDAWRYLRDSALVDLDRRSGTPQDGLHLGAAAGAWLAVARGIGGFTVADDVACFRPRLPSGAPQVTAVGFRLRFRSALIGVTVHRQHTVYRAATADPVTVRHEDETLTLTAGTEVTRRTATGPRP